MGDEPHFNLEKSFLVYGNRKQGKKSILHKPNEIISQTAMLSSVCYHVYNIAAHKNASTYGSKIAKKKYWIVE